MPKLVKLEEFAVKHREALLIISIVSFVLWSGGNPSFLSAGGAVRPVDNCTPSLAISPSTIATGINDVFLLNEDVTLNISLYKNANCTYIGSPYYQYDDRNYSFDYNKPVQVELITSTVETRVLIEVFGETKEEGKFTRSKAIQVIPYSDFERLKFDIYNIIIGIIIGIGNLIFSILTFLLSAYGFVLENKKSKKKK